MRIGWAFYVLLINKTPNNQSISPEEVKRCKTFCIRIQIFDNVVARDKRMDWSFYEVVVFFEIYYQPDSILHTSWFCHKHASAAKGLVQLVPSLGNRWGFLVPNEIDS